MKRGKRRREPLTKEKAAEQNGKVVSFGFSKTRPSLAGQAKAFMIQGAKDLHNAVIPAFPDSAKGVDEPGTPLAPTPAEADRQFTGKKMTMADFRKHAKQKAKEAEQKMDGRQKGNGMEM